MAMVMVQKRVKVLEVEHHIIHQVVVMAVQVSYIYYLKFYISLYKHRKGWFFFGNA
jgi:hypothetical protein